MKARASLSEGKKFEEGGNRKRERKKKKKDKEENEPAQVTQTTISQQEAKAEREAQEKEGEEAECGEHFFIAPTAARFMLLAEWRLRRFFSANVGHFTCSTGP